VSNQLEQAKTLETANLNEMAATIKENPYLRFLLTDREGKTELVVVSPEAYALFKKVVEEAIREEDALPPGEAIKRAFERMSRERGQSSPQ
jgi:hypothetical protein